MIYVLGHACTLKSDTLMWNLVKFTMFCIQSYNLEKVISNFFLWKVWMDGCAPLFSFFLVLLKTSFKLCLEITIFNLIIAEPPP